MVVKYQEVVADDLAPVFPQGHSHEDKSRAWVYDKILLIPKK